MVESGEVLRTVQQEITVLVAESDDLDRRAFVHLLQHTAGLRLLGAANTRKDAVSQAVRLDPDVVLVDLERSEDALGTVAELRRRCPRVHSVILTTAGDVAQLRRAVAAGTSGFVTKSVSVAELREVMLRVVGGERVLDPELSVQALLSERCPLTLREGDILRVSRECTTVADIAATVSLSPGTVRNYLSRAIGKTGARNRHEAAEEAERRGWI
ncbi:MULTISPECIES: response regulator transcription factor [Streptomyces]|uniref:response regulator transcription factor n=1 Tax=Streptomyces TaxID=1883 RepID=UPI0029ADD847|nr:MULTISPECIES: response regulator transcription factor [Streptomyces]MDX3361436.1 response regulator transcription factor [Streptomyces sp. ME02-6978.2a]